MGGGVDFTAAARYSRTNYPNATGVGAGGLGTSATLHARYAGVWVVSTRARLACYASAGKANHAAALVDRLLLVVADFLRSELERV